MRSAPIAYDPYGNVTSSTGSVVNPYRFGGAYGAYTDSSGLLKIGQRYYDSSLGCWTQPDLLAGSLTNPMSLNRYAYASCNPVNSIDPSGQGFNACNISFFAFGAAVSLGILFFMPVTAPLYGWILTTMFDSGLFVLSNEFC